MSERPGAFIISFDCEGRWGFADCLTPRWRDLLSNARLAPAYQSVLELLGRYQTRATFAFVGAFTLSVEEFQEHVHWFTDPLLESTGWLSTFWEDIKQQQWDGWFLPDALELVQHADNHEIASHGFSHLPVQAPGVNAEVYRRELWLNQQAAELKGVTFETHIYPRNFVLYQEILAEFGYLGFRNHLENGLKKRPLKNLLSEFNIYEAARPHDTLSPPSRLVRVPEGYYLNPRSGKRSIVPRAVTVRRWHNIIRDAVNRRRVVHLFAHPWNFAQDPGLAGVFEEILQYAGREMEAGRLVNLTQKEYCMDASQRAAHEQLP